MTTTTETTAGNLRAGQILHAVQPEGRSNVFTRNGQGLGMEVFDLVILAVGPHPEYPDYVRIVLGTTTLNLKPTRTVFVKEA